MCSSSVFATVTFAHFAFIDTPSYPCASAYQAVWQKASCASAYQAVYGQEHPVPLQIKLRGQEHPVHLHIRLCGQEHPVPQEYKCTVPAAWLMSVHKMLSVPFLFCAHPGPSQLPLCLQLHGRSFQWWQVLTSGFVHFDWSHLAEVSLLLASSI